MMIIGERINASRKPIKEALARKDRGFFLNEVKSQVEAGANFIDLNSARTPETELLEMHWLLDNILPESQPNFSIDSATPEVIEAALKKINRPDQLINSTTLEPEKYKKIFPLMLKYHTYLIALLIDENGAPTDADQRLKNVEKMLGILKQNNVPLDRVYVDPLVFTLSTNNQNALYVVETIRGIKKRWPELKTTCGLSNVSYGLPNRKLINRNFLVMVTAAGVDSLIIDPLDQLLMSNLYAANALAGRDESCLEYLTAFRQGKLKE
jgi:cobalamin-dependent methionine synthase I